MVLHASILDVILQSGLQLRQLLLSGRVDVVSSPVVGHLDVLQTMLGSNLLVFCGETHASALTGGHCDRMGRRSSVFKGSSRRRLLCLTAALVVLAGG
jgi:hypothetical protein